MKKLISLFVLAAGAANAQTLDELRAKYAAREDDHARAAILAEANAPSIVTGATTTQVVTARDAKLADREAKYIAELAAAGLSVTNDLDAAADALNANGGNTATLRLGLRLFTLRARIAELGGDSKQATGATATTSTVVTVTRTSPAMQALGRAATAEDLQGSR